MFHSFGSFFLCYSFFLRATRCCYYKNHLKKRVHLNRIKMKLTFLFVFLCSIVLSTAFSPDSVKALSLDISHIKQVSLKITASNAHKLWRKIASLEADFNAINFNDELFTIPLKLTLGILKRIYDFAELESRIEIANYEKIATYCEQLDDIYTFIIVQRVLGVNESGAQITNPNYLVITANQINFLGNEIINKLKESFLDWKPERYDRLQQQIRELKNSDFNESAGEFDNNINITYSRAAVFSALMACDKLMFLREMLKEPIFDGLRHFYPLTQVFGLMKMFFELANPDSLIDMEHYNRITANSYQLRRHYENINHYHHQLYSIKFAEMNRSMFAEINELFELINAVIVDLLQTIPELHQRYDTIKSLGTKDFETLREISADGTNPYKANFAIIIIPIVEVVGEIGEQIQLFGDAYVEIQLHIACAYPSTLRSINVITILLHTAVNALMQEIPEATVERIHLCQAEMTKYADILKSRVIEVQEGRLTVHEALSSLINDGFGKLANVFYGTIRTLLANLLHVHYINPLDVPFNELVGLTNDLITYKELEGEEPIAVKN